MKRRIMVSHDNSSGLAGRCPGRTRIERSLLRQEIDNVENIVENLRGRDHRLHCWKCDHCLRRQANQQTNPID